MKLDWRIVLIVAVIVAALSLAIADAGGRRSNWLILTFCGLLVLGRLLRKPSTTEP